MTSSTCDTARTLDHHVMRAQLLSSHISLHHLYLSYEEEEEADNDHYVMLRHYCVT